MPVHKTSAWPLAHAYAALIVYASLYPFADWRDQGIAPWEFLASPLPRYWTGFDVAANTVGYAPLGFLLALGFLRRHRDAPRRNTGAIALATLVGAGLALAMEALQTYLPSRVPSNVDFALNAAGTLGGAVAAGGLELAGAIDRWGRFRQRWFVAEARGALVLLALWPFALLFPASVPLGLGQVFERLETALAEWLLDTPFLEWLPVRDVELQPLVPGAEMVCVALGTLIPCLLGYSVMQSISRRAVLAGVAVTAGVLATALSAALSWGPVHAWAWLSLPVRLGLVVGLALALVLLPLPRRGCAALVLLALVVHLSLLNQAPASAYFADTLAAWEQGRFIRFNGLAQWLGWLWPYATLVYVLVRVSRAEGGS
ncbi:VanZ family protein [Ramlibacter tataouinensis]|uniref:Candidate membrane protein n=1 Tax=Ramlibacter tataouinensis (strain ATCC BAA-407 / DSM 14655 / LMG 21543 / TTB310) TaxID=365046 RepID=F5Y577_RAMTT|nr:VanZ family protein [Ramlibacter tataouinensis]AEG91387.1 candidate membrane protein [Ramlibacter tataouinensis TTB310]